MPCRNRLARERCRSNATSTSSIKQVSAYGATPDAIAAIRLLILTGCRRGEILSLRWDDVDLQARELRLRDSKTGPRVVPLSPSAVQLLADLPRSGESRWVIPGRKPGTHMCRLGNAWRLLRKRAGLHGVRLHDLRHSFASSALALGESLPMISQAPGPQADRQYRPLRPPGAGFGARGRQPGRQQPGGGCSVGYSDGTVPAI